MKLPNRGESPFNTGDPNETLRRIKHEDIAYDVECEFDEVSRFGNHEIENEDNGKEFEFSQNEKLIFGDPSGGTREGLRRRESYLNLKKEMKENGRTK